MKNKHLFAALLALCLSSVSFAEEDISFSGKIGYVNQYIWRGVTRSDQSNFQAKLKWDYENWHGKFKGTYDNSTSNYITDFDSDWLEFDTVVGYTFSNDNNGKWDVGYIYYSFFDDFHDTQELYVKYSTDSPWNPTFALYYDFDFNNGAYFNAGVSKTYQDREWEYKFGLKLGYFSSFGESFSDQKYIGGTLFQNPRNNAKAMSGLADLVPSVRLTRHIDDESSYSLSLASSILVEDDTYNSMEKDRFVWGLSYKLQF
jgi:hypothetical protein